MPKINITKHLGFTPANTAKGNLTGFTPLNNRRANLMGFTLIELLVVISIIGFLASASLVAFNTVRAKARYARAIADMQQIVKAAELTYDTNSKYPADVGPNILPAEMAGYLNRWPTPPCSGWTYDWENWSSGNDILVSLRRTNVGQVYIYCIFTTSNCAGGTPIQNISSKQITCSE